MTRARLKYWLVVGACVLSLSAIEDTAAPAPVVTTEENIKAAFLFNFAKFVKWPETSFPDPRAALVIGVVDDQVLFETLERAVKGNKVSGRSIVVTQIESAAGVRGCHVVFVGESSPRRVSEILDAARNASILSVGESEDFASHGGIIRLYIKGGRARFEVNPDAAARSGLRIDASLLELATTMKASSPEAAK